MNTGTVTIELFGVKAHDPRRSDPPLVDTPGLGLEVDRNEINKLKLPSRSSEPRSTTVLSGHSAKYVADRVKHEEKRSFPL